MAKSDRVVGKLDAASVDEWWYWWIGFGSSGNVHLTTDGKFSTKDAALADARRWANRLNVEVEE